MFCPECGHPLESESIRFCPNCGSRIIPPATVEPVENPSLSASESIVAPTAEQAPEPVEAPENPPLNASQDDAEPAATAEPVETPENPPLNASQGDAEPAAMAEPVEAHENPPLNASQDDAEPATTAEPVKLPKAQSKLSTAALILGTGAFVFAVLTLIGRMLALNLRVLGAIATATFFLAPLACCFGAAGIIARIRRAKLGLPSAIAGLLLGLVSGAGAAYLLLARVLGL